MVENDPFSEFGGEVVDTKTETTDNPFGEFGGNEINVKKKDVTTSGTQKLSPSSNTESASKSQKQSSVVDKIVNFQIPGVQGNTFKPLTEQQKIAGKNALGQGTAIVPEKKVQTPEVSAKKSAILKAVTGKDIDYEQISSISNPNNTNYTEILASQKEAPKSDNTLTTNPALKEEQRQKQVEQTEFIKNREFKVNNPQANIRILETKDPVLLKDVADKASDFDEIRIAESFNTDSPISKRFSKPSNDVPYKPFTDYLEVSELSTANPMELYETAEKEADRDKQLQYFKDRGKDNILNEFNNEQTAISYKQNLLKKKHETALNNLKQKYGEDINNVEIPQDDKDFVDIVAAQNGLRENYNQSKDLLKSEKYSEVNKMIQERANRQVEIDKDAKEDTWYKFTDEANKIQNVVMNTAYGLLNDIASLPRFVNGIAGGDKFNWTDKVADATQRFTDAGMAYFNTPTNLQRENVQDYAEVDGYKVFLDKKGNVQSIRDKDNFMVNDEVKKREISDKFDANKDKIKVKTDWVDGEQILNQSSKIIGDMLVMVAEGGGIGAGIKGAGKLSKSSRILNLAENAKLTTSLAVISQMQNEMMNDAIDKGMSKSDAAKYAAISSAGVAAISLINPMEAEFLKNIKNVKSLASEEVASFVNGGTTLADLSKKTIRNIIGNSIPEIAEEQFFEPALQNVVNDSYKSHIAEGQELQNTEILGRENLAQSVLTATTTFLPSITESVKNTNSNSVKMDILENPENWMAVMDKKKELGIIEDSEYTAEVSAMQKAKKKYDTLKSEVKQGDRIKLAGLIGDKIAIESKLSDAPELKPKYEKQLSEIETKISNLTNGISDTEAPIEQATDVNIQAQDFGEENKQNTNKDESKTTSTESVNTGQKQDNITGVQQNEQNGGTIQQGNGQNESDQKEVQIEQKQEVSDEKLSRLPKKKKDANIETPKSVDEPIQQAIDNTKEQGVKDAVQPSVDAVGQGNAEVAVAGVKTPISKTETTENLALKGVESTAKALEEVDKSNFEGFKKWRTIDGLSYVHGETSDPTLDYIRVYKNGEEVGHLFYGEEKSGDGFLKGGVQVDENLRKKGIASKMYEMAEQVSGMKFKPDTPHSELAEKLWGSKNRRFGADKEGVSLEQSISEAYHKAKADGSNPELVKAVEDLLGKAPTQYTEAATPKDDSAIQSGSEQKLSDQKEVQVTAEEKINPLESKFKKKIPTEKVEETVEPISKEKQTTQNSENSVNLVQDKNENEYVNTKLTDQDNIEQEPSIKDIESKAESDSETELNEVVKKSDELINEAVGISRIPLSQLSTDESRFQARDELNQDIVDDIANNFSDANQDPIHVWTDPKDGKTYVLSGHHRYYGAKKAGRTDVKIIDRTNDFTEKEAIKFATEEANANRSMETPLERANTLRKKRERGDSKEEIDSFLEKEGKNKSYTDNLSRLNPKGKAIQALKQLGNSTDKVTQKETEKIADWIGDARKTINGITDAHENEMFDFLMDKDTSKRITTKADFLQKVRSVVNPLLSEEPLNLQRFKNKTQGEQSYDEDVAEKKAEIAERQKQIDAINDRFSNPANPDYIRTNSADYAQARKIADDKISKLDAERKALQKQLEDIYRSKGKYVSAPSTGDLFGMDLTADALDRIVDKIGGKKNLTEQEKTSLTKDITDLAKGLLQEGKATIDNIIDKIIDAIKKRLPDLDEKDVKDLADTVNDKVIFSEGVKWYKDNGYTYEQTQKRLDEIDADYTEQELKDAWDGDSKKGKEKALQNRAYRGTTDEELKSMINDYGLTYETESQIIAESEANDIIERIGLDNAFQAVQNGYIKGAQAAVIYAKVVDDVEAKLQKGDLTEEEQTKLKEIQAFLIDMFDSEARDAGRFIAMLKRTNHKSLFNYDTMVKYAEESKGKPLTEEEKLQIKEQSEKIKELDKRIAELETELEEERVNNAIQNIKAQTQKNKASVTFRAKSKGLADKVRKLKTKELVLKDADGNPIKLTQNSIVSYNDIIELVAKTIEKTGELIDGINTALDEIKKQEWYQKLSQRDKDAVDKQVKQDILDLDDDVSDDKFKIPHSLIRDIVKNGTEDIDGIVQKVLEVYHDIYPDLDERKVRDIITKYGEQKIDTRDDIDKKISEAKRIGRHLSGKEDLLNGKPPKRSGFKRDKPTPTERLLMQEIQQLLKNIPKSQEEIDNLWTTALEKAKTRITNRIEELQLAIDKKERINKTKNVQNYNDADLDKLKEQLKQKQSEYDEKFPKEKTTLSDEQRLNQIINSKKKRLEFLKQQRIDKVYERTKKDGVDKSKYPELSKQIADLEAQIKAENEDIKKDEDYKKYIEKKRIALAIKANQRRIEELQRRIKEKDFTVKKNPTPVSDELNKVKKEKQKIVDDYEHAKHKFELENRTGWQKIFDGIIEALSFTKQAKATFDLSAPFRQGATVMISNPMIFGKALKEMHRQAWSDEFYKETIEKIQDSKNYTLAQDSGLEITDVDSINERKRDEQYVSKLMDSEFMKKAPIFSHYRAMNKGSERAYSGFLNNIRFNLFEQGVKELELAGYKFEDNPVMFKALATTINNLTGRGLSPTGKMGKILNFFLFSPKMLTSRFLLAYDLFRKDIPFNSPSRIMAAKSLLGTVAWIGMFNVLGSAASKALSDDDDEKKKSLLKKINYNPIATDFAKVRDKQTTFDPTAGYAPLVRTLARIASEKSINASGAEKDLTKGYGSNRFSPFWEFMENKLSPIASFGVSVATHKNPANKFEKSDNAEWYDYLTPLFVPLTAMQISENWNDKDNFGKDFIELGLGLYGIGVQQYDNTGTGKDKSNSRTSERGTTRENTSRTTSRTTNR